MCFDERVRECPSGGKLSKDGCSCENVVASKPTCSTGCTLNNNGVCRCESFTKGILTNSLQLANSGYLVCQVLTLAVLVYHA